MKILKNNIKETLKTLKLSPLKGIFLYGSEVGVLFSIEDEIKKIFSEYEAIKLDFSLEKILVMWQTKP